MLEIEDGRSVYFERHQSTSHQGRTVVLVHPWALSSRAWDRALSELSTQFDVVLIDQRGCGNSDRDFSDMSVAALGDDVVKVVNTLQLRKPVLNGWSLGGAVAAHSAHALGENVGGLVSTVGATPRFSASPEFPEGLDAAVADGILKGLTAARVDTTMEMAKSVFHASQSNAVIEWIHRLFVSASPSVDRTLYDLVHNIDQRDLLTELKCPALIFGGAHDAFTPHAACERAAQMVPSGRFISCSMSGHAPPLEEPELYFSELTGFLQNVDW